MKAVNNDNMLHDKPDDFHKKQYKVKEDSEDRHMVCLCLNYDLVEGYYYTVRQPMDDVGQVDYCKFLRREFFDLPKGVSLKVEGGTFPFPYFYDNATGGCIADYELFTTEEGIPMILVPFDDSCDNIRDFQKAENWLESVAGKVYVIGTQDMQGKPTETQASYGFLDVSHLEDDLYCVDVDGRTGAIEFTSETYDGKFIRTAAIPIEHLTEEFTSNIHFDRNHRMFNAVRDIIDNQMRVDKAMHEPAEVEGNSNPAVHAVRRAIQKILQPYADEVTGFVNAESIRQACMFKPLGLEVVQSLSGSFPAEELKKAFKMAMPDGEALADECLLTRKEAKENLLRAMSNFYDLERNAGLSAEQVNKQILALAQENNKNKTQQAVR